MAAAAETYPHVLLARQHIQNHSEAQALEPHWGYADRVIPCTNDAGTCEYLDAVYHAHDVGMLYTGIFWATIGGILLIWGISKRISRASGTGEQRQLDRLLNQPPRPLSTIERLQRTVSAGTRRWLLPESARSIFGRTTRLQLLILAMLVGYLTIWTFSGIVYKKWVTPVKNNPGLYNIRSGLGPFSDRIGVLAYALIPLSVLLSSRESILSLITGVPYQHFNFIHRWLGYLILVQSSVHTIGWSVIEIRLYQPQPTVAKKWIVQEYMIWGIVAQIFLLILFIFSLKPVIKLTGYEFFRKAHYVIAMLFIGACWGHWEQLKCFLLPSLLIWGVDRGARLIRTWLIHYNHLSANPIGFSAAQAQITIFEDKTNGDVIRLDFRYPQDAWSVGQHFYLCFPELSIWQSHPFTPGSLPDLNAGTQQHSYIVRAKAGETRKLAGLAARKAASNCSEDTPVTTPVILTGPYGEKTLSRLDQSTNVLCVAGGSGITYVLPVLLHIASEPAAKHRQVELIWAVRMESDVEWIRKEIDILQAAAESHNICIKVFVTRECCIPQTQDEKAVMQKVQQLDSSSSSSASDSSAQIEEDSAGGKGVTISRAKIRPSTTLANTRPDLKDQVSQFVEGVVSGPTIVYASGPGSMISDLRSIVASKNVATKVWQGDQSFDMDLVCDDRIEW